VNPARDIRLSPGDHLDLHRVGADQIVEIDGRPGLFTPFVGADPKDAPSTDNLAQVVDVLRGEVGRLQAENADLAGRLADLSAQSRASDDVAAALQHSLDVLQQNLATMDNPVSNFAVREFQLESKVHVDVTELGTVGYRFAQPGEQLDPGTLSTLRIMVVPVPKPVPDETAAPDAPSLAGVEAIDGLTEPQIAALRSAHVTSAATFERVATRATTTASLISLLGTDRDALGRFVMLAGLLALPGVDRLKAAVLYDAGITDVATLAAAAPADVVRRYAKAAKPRADDDGFRPTKDDATAWITAAHRLVAPSPAGDS
jgi:Domain of unknown function (DUF4332)